MLITHTFNDFDALPEVTDRAKARGFVERSGLVVTGEMAQSDLGDLDRVVGMSGREIAETRSRGVGQPYDSTGKTLPPSAGKFLIKTSGAPGIPIKALRAARLAQLMMGSAVRWDMT